MLKKCDTGSSIHRPPLWPATAGKCLQFWDLRSLVCCTSDAGQPCCPLFSIKWYPIEAAYIFHNWFFYKCVYPGKCFCLTWSGVRAPFTYGLILLQTYSSSNFVGQLVVHFTQPSIWRNHDSLKFIRNVRREKVHSDSSERGNLKRLNFSSHILYRLFLSLFVTPFFPSISLFQSLNPLFVL